MALVLIAELGRPHGVRGLMRVRAFSEAAVTAYNPLVDAQGREQRMPTGFDQDLAHAGIHYRGNDPLVKQNLQILQAAMKQAGFIQLESEWWHFDDAEYLTNPQPVIYGWRIALPGMSPP